MKKEQTELCTYYIPKKKLNYPIEITYVWTVKSLANEYKTMIEEYLKQYPNLELCSWSDEGSRYSIDYISDKVFKDKTDIKECRKALIDLLYPYCHYIHVSNIEGYNRSTFQIVIFPEIPLPGSLENLCEKGE